MKVLVLNPGTTGDYINRDQMGGMGQKISFGKSKLTGFLKKMKTSFIRQPVMQLVYAASILAKKHKVKVIDALNENLSLEHVMQKVREFKPDFVIMAVSSAEINYEKFVAKNVKKITNAKIITIGDTIVNSPELFTPEFDIAIIGEIEDVIEKIIEGNKPDGIIYWENGKIKTKKRKKLLTGEELNKLPFPDWKLFPYKKYRYYPLLYREPAISVLSSRGCPYACYYCSYSKNEGRLLRVRSPNNVVEEIENNLKLGIKAVVFRDPLFTGNKSRTAEICRQIINKDLDIVWSCETRPEVLDKKLLKLMYKAGCRAILMGIESIHEKELKAVGRNKIDLEKLKKVIKICNKLGIRINGFFILGLPGSNKESINKTIQFSLNSSLNHAEYKIATPYPGTKLREIALKKGWIKGNEQELGGYGSVMNINSDFNPDYLTFLCDKAFKSFYYRKKWLIQELKMGQNLRKSSFMLKTIFRSLK